MRISTNTLYKTGTSRMSELETSMYKTQQQMSLGKRILTPSDDPVAAAQILEFTQSQAMNSQYAVNRQNAKNSMGMTENALQGITSLLQDVKTLIVNAGNGSLDNSQRKFIASELNGRYEELIALANSRDGAGNYLFSGYQTSTQPYTKSPAGANYAGDQGQRMLQVGPRREMSLGEPGEVVFKSTRSGDGAFATTASVTNKGNGIISTVSVTDPSLLTGDEYKIKFTSTGFDLVNKSTVPETVSSHLYTSGDPISVPGMEFVITGIPEVNDEFTVKPSEDQSVFTTMNDLISLLNTSVSNDFQQERLAKGLSSANEGISAALDNVLTVRASVGARLKELDSLDSQGDDRDLLYAQSLSKLQDLDYTKTITELSKQTVMLQAAQQAFIKTTGLSLFSFIS